MSGSGRSRRANAGNKLQKLIEQEKLLNELPHIQTAGETDDLVDLIFQTTNEDEEFVEESRTNNDDYFTDEDDDDAEEESDEEAQLKLEEKLQKRKEKRLKSSGHATKSTGGANYVPLLRKRDENAKPKMSSVHSPNNLDGGILNPENLLSQDRRTSSRKSVIENKLKVYKNLTKAVSVRKILQEKILKQQRDNQHKKRKLTQEDRLLESLETEKFNLKSLNKFKELEIYNKEKRLYLQQKNKVKFQHGELVLTEFSCDWRMTPLMEINDYKYWEQQLSKRNSKNRSKKRSTAQRKTPDSTADADPTENVPKTVDDLIKYDTFDSEGIELVVTTEGNADDADTERKPVEIEGPEQRVSRNFVTLFEYDTAQTPTHTELFETLLRFTPPPATKQAQLAQIIANQESMETVLLSNSTTTNASSKDLSATTGNTKGDLIYTQLMDSFPKFGDFNKKFKPLESIEINETTKIQLKTQPPTGLYLPNGVKKPCLIKGTPSQYFDPKFGIPYSDLESYRILQEMVQNPATYKWYGFGKGGILLNSEIKPANGVPEGF